MEVFFIWAMTMVSGDWAFIWEPCPIEYLMNKFRAGLTQERLIVVSLLLWILSGRLPWGERGQHRLPLSTPTRSEDVLLLDIEKLVSVGQPERIVFEAILLYWGNRNVYHGIFGIWPSESAQWHENMSIRQYMGRRCVGETHREATGPPNTTRDFPPLPPPLLY